MQKLSDPIRNGNFETFREILEEREKMALKVGDNEPLVVYLARNNCAIDFLKLLLNSRYNKDEEFLRLKLFDINSIDKNDNTDALYHACLHSNMEMCTILLNNGINVNKIHRDKKSQANSEHSMLPAMIKMVQGKNLEMLKLVLPMTDNETKSDQILDASLILPKNGNTMLHELANIKECNDDVTPLLLDSKLSSCINKLNKDRKTPLMVAIDAKNEKVIEKLCEYQQNIDKLRKRFSFFCVCFTFFIFLFICLFVFVA